jgi:hypothetical protein
MSSSNAGCRAADGLTTSEDTSTSFTCTDEVVSQDPLSLIEHCDATTLRKRHAPQSWVCHPQSQLTLAQHQICAIWRRLNESKVPSLGEPARHELAWLVVRTVSPNGSVRPPINRWPEAYLKPLRGVQLVRAQHCPHAVVQHLGRCAGQAAKPRCLELAQVP